MNRCAVFLDRDGTVNVDVHHLRRAEDLRLIPGAGEAIARLNAAGYVVVVVTNQSVVARGLASEADLARIHAELRRQLVAYDAILDGIYHCPHHPDYGDPPMVCDCRKPAPGMLLRAAVEHGIDLGCSIMVGDSETDLQAGWAAGCRCALVRTGYGAQTFSNADAETRSRIGYVGRDLADVVGWILESKKEVSNGGLG